MEREQITIRLPEDLKEEIQKRAERNKYQKQTTIRLQEELYKELKLISEQTGLTITSLLVVAIWWSVLKTKHLLR